VGDATEDEIRRIVREKPGPIYVVDDVIRLRSSLDRGAEK
jgi:hypothetical protein